MISMLGNSISKLEQAHVPPHPAGHLYYLTGSHMLSHPRDEETDAEGSE